MKQVALVIIVVAAVIVVFGRLSRNTPVAIVGYLLLAVGLILGALNRLMG